MKRIPSELGALKILTLARRECRLSSNMGRMQNEITVLKQKRSGLTKLLDCNESEKWIITEYIQEGRLQIISQNTKGMLSSLSRRFFRW